MHVAECASQPHLWGRNSPSLASRLPLADIPLTDNWNKRLAPVHKSQRAGMASSAQRTNGRRRNASQPGGGCSQIKLINGVCLKSLLAVQPCAGRPLQVALPPATA